MLKNILRKSVTTTGSNTRSNKVSGRSRSIYLIITVLGTALGLSIITHMIEFELALDFPVNISRGLEWAIDSSITWAIIEFGWFFDVISDNLKWVLGKLRDFLIWVPWPIMMGVIAITAWRLASAKIAIGSVIGMIAISSVSLWEPTMVTVAIMLVAVTIAISVGIPLGVLAARNNLSNTIIRPILDTMQTMPSFVYLVPGIMLFGLGNVAAILATVLYAIPPCIRLTNLGIRQVDPDVVEAGRSFGSSNMQILFKIQMPMAIPSIMAGINQTVMMALAMCTIAAMVGAGGLGIEVLRAMGQLREGESVIAGVAIVIMAIIIDRVLQGYIINRGN